jgi:hypothetical protein
MKAHINTVCRLIFGSFNISWQITYRGQPWRYRGCPKPLSYRAIVRLTGYMVIELTD